MTVVATTSWIAPAVATFVERLPELTRKGANRIKTHKFHLAPCDVCWEPTWIAGLGKNGAPCRMTPNCLGRHRREGLLPKESE